MIFTLTCHEGTVTAIKEDPDMYVLSPFRYETAVVGSLPKGAVFFGQDVDVKTGYWYKVNGYTVYNDCRNELPEHWDIT